MMWGKKRINGTVYDLTHLDPFFVDAPLPGGRSSRLRVEFGCHSFTEQITPLHDRSLAFSHGSDLRAFCLKRYGHSLTLPAAVKRAVNERVCLDKGRTLINARLPGLEGPYLIAFKLRVKQTRKFDAVLTVVSAHHRPNLNQKLPSAPFPVVLSAALNGKKVQYK